MMDQRCSRPLNFVWHQHTAAKTIVIVGSSGACADHSVNCRRTAAANRLYLVCNQVESLVLSQRSECGIPVVLDLSRV